MAVTRKGSLRVSYTAAAREPQGRTEDTESCAADFFFQPAESAFLFYVFLLQLLKKLCFVCLFCFDDYRIQGQSRGVRGIIRNMWSFWMRGGQVLRHLDMWHKTGAF